MKEQQVYIASQRQGSPVHPLARVTSTAAPSCLTCFCHRFKPVQQLLQTGVICHGLPGVHQGGTESREQLGALWVHDETQGPAKEMVSEPAPHPTPSPSHKQPLRLLRPHNFHLRPG